MSQNYVTYNEFGEMSERMLRGLYQGYPAKVRSLDAPFPMLIPNVTIRRIQHQ